jgi:phosphodiesterase/alkaline phosphatase D-like protein
VVAAFTGPPVSGGAHLSVASDVAARVDFEVSTSPRMRGSSLVPAGRTGAFRSAGRAIRGLPAGERIYWRPRLTRHGEVAKGQIRSFRNGPGDEPFRVAVAACASQFGPCFDLLAQGQPDVFVWQGDLNYADTHGPLAQTMTGYAGIWRDFLANPRLASVLRSASFVPQRDDHDYGLQDANATNIPEYPWALEPWDALMSPRPFHRFSAGPAEVWVLDQRLFKSDPESPDGPQKTLLGERQRRWLFRTLSASRAQFKIICSPCTLFMPANARDGNWAVGYETEREALLTHLRQRVRGTAIFLTGDTHLTGVYESGSELEIRAAPVGIPKPNDITLVDPLAASKLAAVDGVAYAGDDCHFTMLELQAGRSPRLDVALMREDGATVFSRTFGLA